jgi:hypothetical protein
MTEFIPANAPNDPNKLPVIESVKKSFLGAFSYIVNQPLVAGVYLIFVIFEYYITKGSSPILAENEISFLRIIYVVMTALVICYMTFSVIRFHLKHSTMNFYETIKSNEFHTIFLILLAILIALEAILFFMVDETKIYLLIPAVFFNIVIFYCLIKTTPYCASLVIFSQPKLTLKKAFQLTNGNFWRIFIQAFFIFSPGIALLILNQFVFKFDDFHPLYIIFSCLITCYLYIALIICEAIIYKHLSEKAANA